MSRFACVLSLILMVLLAGCGGSDGNSSTFNVNSGSASTATASSPEKTATVTLLFTLDANAAVPREVTTYRITGMNANGTAVYGPVNRPRTAQVVLTDVPQSVVTIQVIYVVGTTATGVSSAPVDLSSGSTTVDLSGVPVTNLDNLTSLSISPTSASLVPGATQQFRATGSFSDGSRQDLTSVVTWGTTPTTVATIDANGLATSVRIGTASVTASARTVTAPPASLQVAATPIVGGVTPSAGPAAGGNSVAITGSALSGATSVKFGTTSASFVVDSDTHITAVAPAGSGGVDVTVSTLAFTSARSAVDAYTYVPPPTGATVVPNQGPVAGGTQVTLTGTVLAGATAVTIGPNPAIIRGTTPTTVVFTVPPGTAGAADVVVTTPGGNVTLAAGFTYVRPPVIGAIAPNVGPTAGGTSVVISGTSLTGTSAVTVGGAPAVITASTGTSVTVTVPPGAPGANDVVLTTAGGSVTATGGFTYVAPPVLGVVTPNNGAEAGGTSVTISGTNLAGATLVTFGGTPGTITANTSTSITATSPTGTGTVDLAVTTAGGTATVFGAYAYVQAPTAGNVSPAQGPTAGGNTLTITGVGLSRATSVTVGGQPATITVNDATTLQVTAPAGSAGAVDVVVSTVGGASTITAGYTYVLPPSLTGATPAVGPTTGGGAVTINGTDLSGATAVTFAGTPATVTANTPTSVTVTVPAGAAGVAQVAVTTPGGTATASAYTYVATPAITNVSPSNGPTAGGTSVTITGLHLANASGVTVGGQPATITANVDTAITATTPAGALGPANIVVTTAGGSATVVGGFTFTVSPPTVTGVSPQTGSSVGGSVVTVTGTGFGTATGVRFGTVPAAFVVVSPTQITATAPSGSGVVDVFVVNPGGTSAGGAADIFTYFDPPTQTTVVPSNGSTLGGTTVTVTGTNLAGATSVTFRGNPATITGTTATSVTVKTPAGAQGGCDVVVNAPGGTATAVNGFTYVPPPGPGPISPNAGPQTGGTTVAISGVNLAGVTSVTFGGAPATVLANTPTQVTVTTPANANAGAVDVAITTVGGTSTINGGYTYLPRPVVGAINPNRGSTAGGTTVTITGVGLAATTDVRFNGAPAQILANTPTSLTVTTPPNAAGAVSVAITALGGTSTVLGGYTYVDTPTGTAITPSAGSTNGGNTVTITGSSLANATSVTFDGVPATIGVNDNSTLVVTTPASANQGQVDVVVTTDGGTLTLAGGFTYVYPPGVGPRSPNMGPVAGGQSVFITGVNLAQTTAVTFGGVPATITFNTPTSVGVLTPAGSPGVVDIAVTTAGGTGVIAGGYTYVLPPIVTAITPSSGQSAGGDTITITGTDLDNTYEVDFGPNAAYPISSTATSVTVMVPAGLATVDVTLIAAGGSFTVTGGYTYVDPPTITTVSQTSGTVNGGTAVVISGTNLSRTTGVTFGGHAASFGVVSDTVVVVLTPPSSLGACDVVVTTTGGAATAVGAYTYVP